MNFKIISKTECPGRHEKGADGRTIVHRQFNLLMHPLDDKALWPGPAMGSIALHGIDGAFAEPLEAGGTMEVTFAYMPPPTPQPAAGPKLAE